MFCSSHGLSVAGWFFKDRVWAKNAKNVNDCAKVAKEKHNNLHFVSQTNLQNMERQLPCREVPSPAVY